MNDKSIVVINTPKNCRVCPFRHTPWSFCLGEYEKENHCPLKPLPKRFGTDIEDDYAKGWNDCLNLIERESNG